LRLLLSFLRCGLLRGLLFSGGGSGFGFFGIVAGARCQNECCKNEANPLSVKRWFGQGLLSPLMAQNCIAANVAHNDNIFSFRS
jgi:hypothetical protein